MAKAIHMMVRVLDERRSVDFYDQAFGLEDRGPLRLRRLHPGLSAQPGERLRDRAHGQQGPQRAVPARRRLRPRRVRGRRPRRRAPALQGARAAAGRHQGVPPRRRPDGAVLLRPGPGRLQDRGAAAPRPLPLASPGATGATLAFGAARNDGLDCGPGARGAKSSAPQRRAQTDQPGRSGHAQSCDESPPVPRDVGTGGSRRGGHCRGGRYDLADGARWRLGDDPRDAERAGRLTLLARASSTRTTAWATNTTPRWSRRSIRSQGQRRDRGAAQGRHRRARSGVYPMPFVELSEGNQLRALEGDGGQPFFQTMRFKVIAALYNNPRSGRRSATRARPSMTAATSSAASTTSAGCRPARGREPAGRAVRGGRSSWHNIRSQRRLGGGGHRLRRRRRHARQRARPEGHQRGAARGRASARASTTSSTTNGTPSSSSPGSTSARPRAAGGSPRTSRTCRPGSARRWAAPPRTGPAPRCASRSTSSRRAPTYGDDRRAPTCSTGR